MQSYLRLDRDESFAERFLFVFNFVFTNMRMNVVNQLNREKYRRYLFALVWRESQVSSLNFISVSAIRF